MVRNPGSGDLRRSGLRSVVDKLDIHQRGLAASLIQSLNEIRSYPDQLLMPGVVIDEDREGSLLEAGDMSMRGRRFSHIGDPHRAPHRCHERG